MLSHSVGVTTPFSSSPLSSSALASHNGTSSKPREERVRRERIVHEGGKKRMKKTSSSSSSSSSFDQPHIHSANFFFRLSFLRIECLLQYLTPWLLLLFRFGQIVSCHARIHYRLAIILKTARVFFLPPFLLSAFLGTFGWIMRGGSRRTTTKRIS